MQAQIEMQRRGLDANDPVAVGVYAKEMLKGGMAVEFDKLGVSNDIQLSVITLADEYIRTDDTPYTGLYGQMVGLPFIANPTE